MDALIIWGGGLFKEKRIQNDEIQVCENEKDVC